MEVCSLCTDKGGVEERALLHQVTMHRVFVLASRFRSNGEIEEDVNGVRRFFK